MEHIGEVYGLYQIVGLAKERANDGHKQYLVHCAICDAVFVMQMSGLKYTKSKQNMCSMHNPDKKIQDEYLNHIFYGMRERCYNPKYKDYNTYGGKGIKICREWYNSPAMFEKWAIENGYKRGLTIDRINSNGDYCPDNCRWLTREDNSRYKSTTNVIVVDGMRMSGKQWAQYFNIGINVINTIYRKHGADLTIRLIREMMKRKPNSDVVLKRGQSWLDAYEVK